MTQSLPSLPKHSAATQAGEDWLTMALDSFHDYNVPIAGLPDRTNVPTAVQFVKRKVTIVAPPGLTGTQTWDAHVFSLPVLTTYAAQATNGDKIYEDCEAYVSSAPVAMGNINVTTMQTGNPTYVQDSFAVWDDPSTAHVAYSPTDGNKASQIRLIGGAFEVHNDTAELYKNGSVTCYSSTNDWSDTQLAKVGPNTSVSYLGMVKKARYPPVFSTDAALYTDARTWSAADGAYVPIRLDLDCPSIKFRPRSQNLPIFQDKESGVPDATTGKMVANGVRINAGGITDGGALTGTIDFSVAGGGGAGEFDSNGWLEAPCETTGAFFSGLSQETVLTLDIRWLCEIAPTSANPAMLSMCSPSAHYDPRALECYTNCLLKLPPGVPVGMNEKGDFWRMVIKTAKDVNRIAAPLLSATPTGAAFSTAANAALAFSEMAIDRKAKQRKAVKPQPKAAKTAGPNNTFRNYTPKVRAIARP